MEWCVQTPAKDECLCKDFVFCTSDLSSLYFPSESFLDATTQAREWKVIYGHLKNTLKIIIPRVQTTSNLRFWFQLR